MEKSDWKHDGTATVLSVTRAGEYCLQLERKYFTCCYGWHLKNGFYLKVQVLFIYVLCGINSQEDNNRFQNKFINKVKERSVWISNTMDGGRGLEKFTFMDEDLF